MQARIDMFRDVDSYWGKNVPVLPREGTGESPMEIRSLVLEPEQERSNASEAASIKTKPVGDSSENLLPAESASVGFGTFMEREKSLPGQLAGREVQQKAKVVSQSGATVKKKAVTEKESGGDQKAEAPAVKSNPAAESGVARRPSVAKRPRQKVVLRRAEKQPAAKITIDESGKGDDDIALSS
jgi:hypothetical protein